MSHSVPQGTVLGPLLFTIYVNGLLNQNIDGEILCFANDTAVIFISDWLNTIQYWNVVFKSAGKKK